MLAILDNPVVPCFQYFWGTKYFRGHPGGIILFCFVFLVTYRKEREQEQRKRRKSGPGGGAVRAEAQSLINF